MGKTKQIWSYHMKLVFAIPLVLCHAIFACQYHVTPETISAVIELINQKSRRTRKIATEHLHSLIRQSSLGRRHDNPSELAKRLTFATLQFHTVPGFINTLIKALHQREGGHLYEIEIALNFAQKNKKIIAFNAIKQMPSRTTRREFDIIIKNEDHSETWVECKSHLPHKIHEPIQTQFYDQKEIAQTHTKASTVVHYMVCSKTPFSQEWQNWFAEQEIEACESDSSEYEYDSEESN